MGLKDVVDFAYATEDYDRDVAAGGVTMLLARANRSATGAAIVTDSADTAATLMKTASERAPAVAGRAAAVVEGAGEVAAAARGIPVVGILEGVASKAPLIGIVAGGCAVAYDLHKKDGHAVARDIGGTLAGIGAAALVGATVGSIVPGAGTVVGCVVAVAVVGATTAAVYAGAWVGDHIAGTALDRALHSETFHKIENAVGAAADTAVNTNLLGIQGTSLNAIGHDVVAVAGAVGSAALNTNLLMGLPGTSLNAIGHDVVAIGAAADSAVHTDLFGKGTSIADGASAVGSAVNGAVHTDLFGKGTSIADGTGAVVHGAVVAAVAVGAAADSAVHANLLGIKGTSIADGANAVGHGIVVAAGAVGDAVLNTQLLGIPGASINGVSDALTHAPENIDRAVHAATVLAHDAHVVIDQGVHKVQTAVAAVDHTVHQVAAVVGREAHQVAAAATAVVDHTVHQVAAVVNQGIHQAEAVVSGGLHTAEAAVGGFFSYFTHHDTPPAVAAHATDPKAAAMALALKKAHDHGAVTGLGQGGVHGAQDHKPHDVPMAIAANVHTPQQQHGGRAA